MRRPEVIEKVREVMRTYEPEAQTILYGSEARGEARPDSDIDLLILLKEEQVSPEREHNIVRHLFEVELQTGVIISSLIMPRHRWEHPKISTPFYNNVKKEGIKL